MAVSGRAAGVVVATGSETELGRINQLLASVSALETPLLRQIKKFGNAITTVIAVVSILVFAYGRWVKAMDFVEIFQAVVGIAVSVIPEGLPALITITLAIGVQRMAQRNAIIRRLPAVETLGSVSRICSDKTGTLTLMEMMVVSAATADGEYRITGDGYASTGEVKKDGKPAGKNPVLELLGRVSMLCNHAELFQQDGVWKGGGRSDGRGALPSPPSSEWTGKPRKRRIRGSTPSHSSRSTVSWRRSMKVPAASSFCW
jgi:magnesium-transporting ATPase (P-type)